MDQNSKIDFRNIYEYRFEELLMLFRKNSQFLTDEHKNAQDDLVIDICGSDFRKYRSVIAINESWVVYSIEKLIMGMLDMLGVDYSVPSYDEINPNGKKGITSSLSFVKNDGNRQLAYIIRNKQTISLNDIRTNVHRYPEIDGVVFCFLNSSVEQVKMLNDIERKEDNSFIRFLTLRELFNEQFGELEFPIFLEYANRFNERARNLIGYKIMAIPTSDAISRFKLKTVCVLEKMKYDELLPSSFDRNQYSIVYHNYIGRRLFELMVENTDFGDSFISSEWYYNVHTITGAIDQTGIVTGYLKSVEQLLYAVLKLYMGKGRRIGISGAKKDSFSGTIYGGKYIDFVQDNESYFDKTLGSLIHFIKSKNWYGNFYNADLFDVNPGTIQFLIDELYKFKDIERNDHLHKDNLYTSEEVYAIRNRVFFLYFLILGSFSIPDAALEKLGKVSQLEPAILSEEDLEKKIADWVTPIICYDVPRNTKVLAFSISKFMGHPWQIILQGLEGIDKHKYSSIEWNHKLAYSSSITNNILSWEMANDWNSGVNMIVNVLTKMVYTDTALGEMLRRFPEIVLGNTEVIKIIHVRK